MADFSETEISKAILSAYYKKLGDSLESDAIVVGAGPAGMTAAIFMARSGLKVVLLERRLSPGGGTWGGGMAMNEAVIQTGVLGLLDEIGVGYRPVHDGLYTIDTIELAAALALKAVQSGVILLNLMTAEDVCVHNGRVTGVVTNRTMIGETLPVDPIMLSASAVVDATGHDAIIVQALRRRGYLREPSAGTPFGEGPLDAAAGEAFVVEKTCELFPGLWVSGMSVCAALGGPRMGPIFGGMLLSGYRVADLVLRDSRASV